MLPGAYIPKFWDPMLPGPQGLESGLMCVEPLIIAWELWALRTWAHSLSLNRHTQSSNQKCQREASRGQIIRFEMVGKTVKQRYLMEKGNHCISGDSSTTASVVVTVVMNLPKVRASTTRLLGTTRGDGIFFLSHWHHAVETQSFRPWTLSIGFAQSVIETRPVWTYHHIIHCSHTAYCLICFMDSPPTVIKNIILIDRNEFIQHFTDHWVWCNCEDWPWLQQHVSACDHEARNLLKLFWCFFCSICPFICGLVCNLWKHF